MNGPILVKIIGAPIACQDGIKDSWREVAGWAAGQLRTRYGESVQVQYYNLFDLACPSIPADGQLPVVWVNESLVSCGGKISAPKPGAEIFILAALEDSWVFE